MSENASDGGGQRGGSDAVGLNTIRDRLRWAIYTHQRPQGRERGLRLFQRSIARRSEERADRGEPSIPGTSLQSIMTYLRPEDPTTPTVDFILEAAGVLEVRPEWLTFGVGFPTAEHEARADVADPIAETWAALERGAPELTALDPMYRSNRSAVRGLVSRIASARQRAAAAEYFVSLVPFDSRVEKAATDVEQLLLAPVRLFFAGDVEPSLWGHSARAWSRYAAAMTHALELALDAVEESELDDAEQ
jgi:hypothetical protein